MKTASFSGGLSFHVPKNIEYRSFESLPPPNQAIIPLKQHQGFSCSLLVKKGSEVQQGDIIGESESTTIHAPIAGKVTEVDNNFPYSPKEKTTAVTIEPGEGSSKNLFYLQELQPMGKLLKAGVIDFSSQNMPLIDKIAQAQKTKVNTLIINGLDEMLLQGYNSTLLALHTQEVLQGAEILKEILDCDKVYIVVYEKSAQAISALYDQISSFQIVPVKAKHPQHKDHLLVSAVTKKEFPAESSPEEFGVTIFSAETAYSINRVLNHNEPVLSKLITVYGTDLDSPHNLKVNIGTPIREIIEYLNISLESVGKIISGGPLTGQAIYNIDTPITKETKQIYIQNSTEVIEYQNEVCIKCGLCVEVCPMRLMPFLISGFSEGGYFELAEKNDIFSCIECGCCAYVCPVKIPMVQWIQLGKSALRTQKE